MYGAITVLVSLYIFSCAAQKYYVKGNNFDENKIEKLIIGNTTKNEIKNMFGNPLYFEGSQKNIGSFKRYVYHFENVNININVQKSLIIELKDAVLNGYIYRYADSLNARLNTNPSFSKEQISNKILINKSTKEEAIVLLGKPSGKFLFPSTMKYVQNKFIDNSSEIWIWNKNTVDGQTLINIIFTQDGLVQKIIF